MVYLGTCGPDLHLALIARLVVYTHPGNKVTFLQLWRDTLSLVQDLILRKSGSFFNS